VHKSHPALRTPHKVIVLYCFISNAIALYWKQLYCMHCIVRWLQHISTNLKSLDWRGDVLTLGQNVEASAHPLVTLVGHTTDVFRDLPTAMDIIKSSLSLHHHQFIVFVSSGAS